MRNRVVRQILGHPELLGRELGVLPAPDLRTALHVPYAPDLPGGAGMFMRPQDERDQVAVEPGLILLRLEDVPDATGARHAVHVERDAVYNRGIHECTLLTALSVVGFEVAICAEPDADDPGRR